MPLEQFQDQRLRSHFNLVSFDTRYYGRTTGKQLDYYQDLEASKLPSESPSSRKLTFAFSSKLSQERADELLDAIDAVIGDRPFVIFGESFVGANCCAYIASKRPQSVSFPFFRSLHAKNHKADNLCPNRSKPLSCSHHLTSKSESRIEYASRADVF